MQIPQQQRSFPAIPPSLADYVQEADGIITIAPSRGRRLTFWLGLGFFLVAASAPFVAFGLGANETVIAQSMGLAMSLFIVPVIALRLRFWSNQVAIDRRKQVLISVARRSHDVYPLADLRLADRRSGATRRLLLLNQRSGEVVASLRLVGRKEQSTFGDLRALLGHILDNANPEQQRSAQPEVQASHLLATIVVTLAVFFLIVGCSVGSGLLFSCITGTGLAGFLFVLAVLFTLLVLRTLQIQMQSTSWPHVQGVVLERGRSVSSDSATTEHIRFRYTVDGQEHTGRSNDPAADSVPGGPLTVYYHPRKPDRSVLRPGVSGSLWFVAIVFVGLTVAATIWMRSEWQGFDLRRVVEALREF